MENYLLSWVQEDRATDMTSAKSLLLLEVNIKYLFSIVFPKPLENGILDSQIGNCGFLSTCSYNAYNSVECGVF